MVRSSILDRLDRARKKLLDCDDAAALGMVAELHVQAVGECFDEIPMVACLLDAPEESASRISGAQASRVDADSLRAIVGNPVIAEFPVEMQLDGYRPAVAKLAGCKQDWGYWVLASPPEAAAETELALWGLAGVAASKLELSRSSRRLQAYRQTVAEQRQLCILADLISPVAHELQNVLNSMLLQAAIVERTAAPEIRDDLAKIRTLGVQAGEVMKRFNQYRYGQSLPTYPVDLQQAVRRTLQRFTKEGPPPIESSFCSEEISIRGALTDVDRLVELLLRQATSATKAAGRGTVRCETSVEDGRALLVVKDQAGTVAPEQLKELFNTDGRVRSGGDSMELLACQALVRRLGGVLKAENDEDGLAMLAEFEMVSPQSGETRD